MVDCPGRTIWQQRAVIGSAAGHETHSQRRLVSFDFSGRGRVPGLTDIFTGIANGLAWLRHVLPSGTPNRIPHQTRSCLTRLDQQEQLTPANWEERWVGKG